MPRTIRLLAPILAEGVFVEEGTILDATNDAATFLTKQDPPLAEVTDAAAWHPSIKLLHSVTAVPVPEKPKKNPEPVSKDKP